MVIEGKRWLDDAFACAGEARRTHAGAGADRPRAPRLPRRRAASTATTTCEAALEIFERHDDVESMALAYSFYAELAAARGDHRRGAPAPAGRARLLRRVAATTPFAIAARAYSLGEAGGPGRRPRRSRGALPRRGRRASRGSIGPSCSRCRLDVVADFDERAGDYRAAVRALDAGDRDERRVRTAGLHRVAARPPRLGAAPRRRRGARRDDLPSARSTAPAGCATRR